LNGFGYIGEEQCEVEGEPSYRSAAVAVNTRMDLLSMTSSSQLLNMGLVDMTDHVGALAVEKLWYIENGVLASIESNDFQMTDVRHHGHPRLMKFEITCNRGDITVIQNTETGEFECVVNRGDILAMTVAVIRVNFNRQPR
jgi:hypothetical protein